MILCLVSGHLNFQVPKNITGIAPYVNTSLVQHWTHVLYENSFKQEVKQALTWLPPQTKRLELTTQKYNLINFTQGF